MRKTQRDIVGQLEVDTYYHKWIIIFLGTCVVFLFGWNIYQQLQLNELIDIAVTPYELRGYTEECLENSNETRTYPFASTENARIEKFTIQDMDTNATEEFTQFCEEKEGTLNCFVVVNYISCSKWHLVKNI